MGRVINPDGSGKQRKLLIKSVVLAIHELDQQKEFNHSARDIVAYIVLSLQVISKTVDSSVAAWERRGYWMKADKFHLDWVWTEKLGRKLHQALIEDDWKNASTTIAQLSEKLANVTVPKRYRMGSPWQGAWKKLTESSLSGRFDHRGAEDFSS